MHRISFSVKKKDKGNNGTLQLFLLLLLFIPGILPLSAQNLTRPNIEGPSGLQVNSYTGSLFYQRTDLIIPGKGLPLDITFYYNSADRDKNFGYGYGWTFTYNQFYTINPGNDSITFHKPDGRKDSYYYSFGRFVQPKGIFDSVSKYATNKFVLKTKDGTQYFFDDTSHKKLTRIRERNGNEITLGYTGSDLTSVTDASGRVIHFNWSGGHMVEILAEARQPARAYTYTYDNAGYLTGVKNPTNNTWTYAYGAERTMTLVKDANGNNTTIEYNGYVAVRSLISCQRQKDIIYNGALSRVSVIEKGDGKTIRTTYIFDNDGRLVRREGACCGYKTAYGYDEDNNINRITDARDNATVYSYDRKGNLVSETDASGKIIRYTYEPVYNQVSSITDKRNNKTSYTYDANGNLLQIQDPLSNTLKYEYNADGTLKSSTDKKALKTTYNYDPYGYVQSVADPANNTTSFLHDAWGNTTAVTDAENHTTKYEYDSINRQVKEINAYETVSRQYTYDGNGNRLSVKDANGNQTIYYYSPYDQLIGYKDASDSTAYTMYDPLGNMTAATDMAGHRTQYKYDDQNRLIETTNAEGEKTSYSYDANGNKTTVYLPNNNIINNEFDPLNRLMKSSDRQGLIAEYKYDENGNKVSEKDATGNSVKYVYDVLNRLMYKSDALGNSWKYEYDASNNVVKETDRRDKPFFYKYDLLNRLDTVIDARNAITVYTYDKVGNQVSVTDAKSNTTHYQYDALNRKIGETFADNSTKTYTYDTEGNLLSRKDNNGHITEYVYDKLNRPVVRIYPATIDSFSYNANGLMRKAKSNAATITFTYDKTNRVKSETLNGKITSYSYNISAGIKTITYPGGRIIQRQMDNRNYLKAIMENGKELAGFDYNAAGQNTTKRYGNGTSATLTYNGNGQISNLTYNPGGFTNIDYAYNKEGSPTTAQFNHHPSSTENYTTDEINQLKTFSRGGVQQAVFNYDSVGNRTTAQINGTTATYAVNNMNAYTNIVYGSTVSPAYDVNGNTLTSGTQTYTYDDENRITAVNGGAIATYTYDALGRRIKKIAADITTNYYFDGQQIVEERNASDSLLATYIWGTWIDDIVSMNRNNKTYYYHTNHLGSVVSVTNTTGAVVERYEYDAFGKLSIFNGNYISVTSSNIGNTYTFTGRQYEPETGLYYYRARYYDAVHGRFLQRDPLGYVDGLGLYAYVGNIPSIAIDPLGTKSTNTCEYKKCYEELKAWFHSNFIGPGSENNPFFLISCKTGKYLQPIDEADFFAQQHDYAYFINRASGVAGALGNLTVIGADERLYKQSKDLMTRYENREVDPNAAKDKITGQPITLATYARAFLIYEAFNDIYKNKQEQLSIDAFNKSDGNFAIPRPPGLRYKQKFRE